MSVTDQGYKKKEKKEKEKLVRLIWKSPQNTPKFGKLHLASKKIQI